MKTRNPKLTALEERIVQDGVNHHVSRALAIKTVREAEAAGLSAEDIAKMLQIDTNTKPTNTLSADQLAELLAA